MYLILPWFLKKKLTRKKNLQYFFYEHKTTSSLMATNKQKSTKLTAVDYANIKHEIDEASSRYIRRYGF